MYFDSHAHLDLAKEGEDEISAQLGRAWSAQLVGLIAVAGATKVGDYETTLVLAREDPRIRVAAGIHPHNGSMATIEALDDLRRVLDSEEVVALGEIGLDYHYNRSTPSQQRRAFSMQLKMAHDASLPIVIHTREADEDTISILKDEGADELGGVIHCFSSGERLAGEALEMGLHLSFSGIVTFPRAQEIQMIAAQVPEDRILAETDSPFLSPVPFRGKTNEPCRVVHVVEKIASLRGIETEEMARITVSNTCRCFGIEMAREEG